MQQFCKYGSVRGASGQLASLPRQIQVSLAADSTFHVYNLDSDDLDRVRYDQLAENETVVHARAIKFRNRQRL